MTKEERRNVLQKLKAIADYCETKDCRECMFFRGDDGCVLNYVPARRNDIDNYIKEQTEEYELGGGGEDDRHSNH